MTWPDDEDNCTNQSKMPVKSGLSEIGLLGINLNETTLWRHKCSNNSLGIATHLHLNLTCQACHEVNCVHFMSRQCIAYRKPDHFHTRS